MRSKKQKKHEIQQRKAASRCGLAAFCTAEEMFSQFPADAKFTDTQLRNIDRELDPDGVPWIPKAENNLRPTVATLAGLMRRANHRAAQASAEARFDNITFPSMESCEARTGIPKSFQQAAKQNGCDAFESSRVRLANLIRWVFTRGDDSQVVNWSQHSDKFKALNEEVKYRSSIGELKPDAEIIQLIQEASTIWFSSLKRLRQEAPREFEMRDKAYIAQSIGEKLDTAEAQTRARLEAGRTNQPEANPA